MTANLSGNVARHLVMMPWPTRTEARYVTIITRAAQCASQRLHAPCGYCVQTSDLIPLDECHQMPPIHFGRNKAASREKTALMKLEEIYIANPMGCECRVGALQGTRSLGSNGRRSGRTSSSTTSGPRASRRAVCSTRACRSSRILSYTAAESAERRADRSTRSLEDGSCATRMAAVRIEYPVCQTTRQAPSSAIGNARWLFGAAGWVWTRWVWCSTFCLDRIVNGDHLLMNLCRAEGPAEKGGSASHSS